MSNSQIQKIKESPVITSLTIVAIVAASLTGLGTITGWYDASHTTQVELTEVEEKVDSYSVQSKCQALRIQVTLVEQAIWQMEQTTNNSQRLVDKKRELRDLLARYSKLNCATVLA